MSKRLSRLAITALVLGSGLPALAQPDRAPTLAAEPAETPRPATTKPASVKLARLASLLGSDDPIRIVAFGSSSTQGVGASSPASTYPALLQRDLEKTLQIGASRHRSVTVVNRGRGGDDARDMARRLARDVLAEHPDVVIWQTGSNDPLKGVPVERFKELTRDGILAIRATGADVVLMDQQWCQRLGGVANAAQYGEALHALAAELGVPVIRRHEMMQSWITRGLMTPQQMIGPDGLHMTDAGYSRLARSAATQILSGAGLAQSSLVRN